MNGFGNNHNVFSVAAPVANIAFSAANNAGTSNQSPLPPIDPHHRAVHKIRLSALAHNYGEVEAAANRQRCSVIVVVKADGYGHGAVQTAVYLADSIGADAFAVATLEEAIALRKAFEQTPPGQPYRAPNGNGSSAPSSTAANNVSLLFQKQGVTGLGSTDDMTTLTAQTSAFGVLSKMPLVNGARRRSMRQAQIRILVLGAPVGVPRCFDEYYHHNVEVMISGPEVAKALLEWVYNTEERKRTQVERAAAEAKEQALQHQHSLPPSRPPPSHQTSINTSKSNSPTGTPDESSSSQNSHSSTTQEPRYHPPSATLSNVTGSDLAKEVRRILQHQQSMQQHQQQQQNAGQVLSSAPTNMTNGTASTADSTISPLSMGGAAAGTTATHAAATTTTAPISGAAPAVAPRMFAGIEEAAKHSRARLKAKTQEFLDADENDEAGDSTPTIAVPINPIPSRQGSNGNQQQQGASSRHSNIHKKNHHGPRKRLRWHALVDSGMGRLGFRTNPLTKEEQIKKLRRDSVEIIKELVDLEFNLDCPIEFFGMCTHMADANATSDYTQTQIEKFKFLLQRVRTAGISVPTISTDNSAALLTTTLKHFDPKELLTQKDCDTRGFVRTGGAIYGQRPAFPQLRAVSTFMASVRHVAILKQNDSVGYDRAYIAPRNVRIATLAVGFADGYPRELGNRVGRVCIRNYVYPVVGKVCMDMMMVELGPAEDKDTPGAQVVVGDTAILWGPADGEDGEGQVKLRDIADRLDTTQSALTCGVNKERVQRQYE